MDVGGGKRLSDSSIPGNEPSDASATSEDSVHATQLLEAFQTGLREVVQDAIQPGGQDGWACLEALVDFLAGWFRHPAWHALWAFMTTADSTDTAAPAGLTVSASKDTELARAVKDYRHEQQLLLDRLARAVGTRDPDAFGGRVRVMVQGSGVAAALDDGSTAAGMLRALLKGEYSRAAA
jgi:hypothetical protein